MNVVPIEEPVAKEVRATLLAPDYGHPASAEDVDGTSPCRLCLTMIEDRRILFTYDAFRGQEDIPLPGPVFVHEGDCTPYAAHETFPPEFRRHSLVLDAYRAGREQVAERRIEGVDADAALAELLADADYVHVRSAKAGCYLFTVR
ncbi:DUF1203 domain-containing protein [Amycolatopsis sp. cg5]|uniref:DUF1203 domain-containing protein n=1 Tax=Amycolatopsis sp. cg5 TaxID=3238802 RepID=UPI00352356A0